MPISAPTAPSGNTVVVSNSKSSEKNKVGKQKANGNSAKKAKVPLRLGRNINGSEDYEEIKETLQDQGDDRSPRSSASNHLDDQSRMKANATMPLEVEDTSIALSDKTDSGMRTQIMLQERESSLAEIEQLRKSLEDIQNRHVSDLSSIKLEYTEEISKIREKHVEEISMLTKEHNEEITLIKTELENSIAAKDAAETQYQHLLERLNTIKSSLGERFKADRQELADAKTQIEELELQRNTYEERVKELEEAHETLVAEHHELCRKISILKEQYDLSQQNLSRVHEDLTTQTSQLKDEVEAAKEATEGWEMLAMEERSMRKGLTERITDLEEQAASQGDALNSVMLERDSYLKSLESLHRNFEDSQDAHKHEYREMVKSYESQIQDLKMLVKESDSRASEANSSKSMLQAELVRLAPTEKELKEKNLLIGKLRHEAIVLNDHLTKALRFLKKAKPEDNIDRQIVTNHFLHFLALDRSDPKKFQVLQLIASLLNWTDEQKEQAGLARPGASNFNHRLTSNTFYRTPSTPSLSIDSHNETSARKESLTELWKGFMEQSADEGGLHNPSGSITSTKTEKN